MGTISPIILLTIVILAVVFFIVGLLQLLIRCCKKRPSFSSIYQSNSFPETSNSSHTFQRQLHHLFRLHDLGLDRALIDALPVFYYKDIVGSKEPFDCAVCLCEFSDFDKLKFIPSCGHAFHVHCIETWLLSNSTCPLCRGLISPTFEFNESRQWNREYGDRGDEGCQNGGVLQENGGESRVFSIRLGKLKSPNEDCDIAGDDIRGEIRRCYSLGAFQYVVDSLDLQIQLSNEANNRLFDSGGISSTGGVAICDNGKYVPNGDGNEKKISVRTRGDSFSVSKIWLWPKKDTFLGSSDSNVGVSCSSIGMPVSDRTNAV